MPAGPPNGRPWNPTFAYAALELGIGVEVCWPYRQRYLKRQQLLDLGEPALAYLTEMVHRRPKRWAREVDRLHELLQLHGAEPLRHATPSSAAYRPRSSAPNRSSKTHLAVAIAYRAIQNGFEALFTTAAHLIEDLRRRPSSALSRSASSQPTTKRLKTSSRT